MNLTLIRFSHNNESTLGSLYIDGKPECFILEDQPQQKKVMHETRIPAGTYKIKLRTEGRWNMKMLGHKNDELRKLHKGMLWLQDVKGFEYILIHPGNTDNDTSGCMIPGTTVTHNAYNRGYIANSTEAYINLYRQCIEALNRNEDVRIQIIDIDTTIMDAVNKSPEIIN